MKKFIAILLVILLAFWLVGCSQETPLEPDQETSEELVVVEPVAKKALKVGMVLAGPISDHGWNATAYNGLEIIKNELNAETMYAESVQQSDFEETFRLYAEYGCDVIIGHGFQFGDTALLVAPDYPDSIFVVTSSDVIQEPNVASLNNHNLQQGFLAGAFSAMMSESGMIGTVNSMKIPSIEAYDIGFSKGAGYIDPEVEVLSAYIGDFVDGVKAKEIATAMINQGVDIIAHNADSAGLGVIDAAEEMGIPCVGTITDQNFLAPDTIITSALSNLSDAIFVFVEAVQAGEFEAKTYLMGVAEGCVGMAPYHNFEDKVPEEVKVKMEEFIEGFKNGSLDAELN